jgi:hypothetical protein
MHEVPGRRHDFSTEEMSSDSQMKVQFSLFVGLMIPMILSQIFF